MNNTEDSESFETWMQSILRAPETDSEEVMQEEPFETWEEFSKDLEPPSGIHLREDNGNQVATASLNQATIARGEIAWNKPYHSTSLAHFTNEAQAQEYLCLMGQVAGTLPVCHRMGLLYQFFPDAKDNTWTP